MENLGTLLSVWAHPDDETFLAGGVMAAAIDDGRRVVCVSATSGEHGTPDPARWPPDRLGRVRRWEASAALAVLGVTEHHVLGHPDGGLADLDPEGPVAWLTWLMEEVRPDTILTFGPDGVTFHPDHCTVSAWTTAAWHRSGRRARLLQTAASTTQLEAWGELYERWQIYMSDERPAGVPPESLAIDLELSGPALDRKYAALAAMHTQTAGSIALLGEETFRAMNARESFIAAEVPVDTLSDIGT